MSKPNFCIVIPTINRVDMLLPYILMYRMNMPNVEILIYDNGKQDIALKLVGLSLLTKSQVHSSFLYRGLTNIQVFGGEGKNIGVAAAWNFLCEKAFEKYRHVLVLNDDIFLDRSQPDIDDYIIYMKEHHIEFFGCEEKYDWSAFLISRMCWESVGQFDDNFFPAYMEDKDYHRRMLLAAQKIDLKFDFVPALNPSIFKRSSSMLGDKLLAADIADSKKTNEEYYKAKWGGMVGAETYRKPFGNR